MTSARHPTASTWRSASSECVAPERPGEAGPVGPLLCTPRRPGERRADVVRDRPHRVVRHRHLVARRINQDRQRVNRFSVHRNPPLPDHLFDRDVVRPDAQPLRHPEHMLFRLAQQVLRTYPELLPHGNILQ